MACYAAGVLLAAFAALVALPSQAQAQTEVWSGTLTVRDNSGTLGCSNFFASNFCSVHLTDDDFTHALTDYAVTIIFLRTNGQLEITFDTDLATATQGLTLNVDGTAFAFEDADTQSAAFRRWNSSGVSWTAGDSVSLTLTESADAPDPPTDLTANAKGETQIDLSWTAPADNGGEAISGYKVEVSANGGTTWSDVAADTASTDTTYSHTGLAAGNTRHYRVSAINSGDTGDASGVAGATTAAANVLVSNTGRSWDITAIEGLGDQDETHSQGFDTGPNPGGYSLASVGVYVWYENLAGTEAFTVHIYTAASNGTLDTLQHTLTSPASYTDNAVNTFTAPAGATLDASTDYLVVFEGTANTATNFVLGVTESNAQDGGTRAGWAIENARRFNGTTSSSRESFQISVNGTAIPTPMPSNSGLVPTGLTLGDTFRLLFLSSTRRSASASGIGTYNTHVQTAAAAGHTAIQAYSAGFRAVGCTSSQDANVNTRTLYTTSDQGVPIHWLNGAKAADDYADFYDGDWDEEAALKDESGTAASTTGNYPWTGCDHDGTELSGDALGSGSPVLGAPDSSFGTDGPISSSFADSPSDTHPLYGLSELFQVAAAVVPNNAPTFPSSTAARNVAENTLAGQDIGGVLTATDSDGDTLTYTLEGTDAAAFALVTTTDPAAQIRTKAGVTYNHEAKSTYTVVVKADDTKGGTATVTVTITVTDVTEPPEQPAAPSVSPTAGSTTSLDVSWTAPTNTGPLIDTYDLRYQKTTESNWTNGPQNVTGTSAAIGSLDAGTAYWVQVRATNAEGAGGWSPAATGTTTATGNTAATGNPAISGTAQVGMTLAAAPGDIADADGLTGVSYSYRWRRAEVDIPGATSSNYTLTSADYGQEIEVRANFTDDGGNAEQRSSAATLPVAPAAAACPADAATVWCTALTVGLPLDADGDPAGSGYEARPGRAAFGSLGGAAFRHLGVDYTVTQLTAGGGTQDLYFATTPNLPADGAGLTVHVQTYGGELDAPLAEGVFQSGTQDSWFFQGKVYKVPTTPLSDVPLLRGPPERSARVSHPPDLGTEVAVRLSYASTVLPGQTAVTFGASSYTASEGGAPATVAVELSPAPTAPVTIPLTPSRQGGATPGDYSGVPPNVTFQAGQTRRTFTVTATDDSVDDDGESVRIGFGTLPDGFVAGARPTATVALADNDGPVTEVFFDGAADLTVKEGNVTRVSVYLSEPARATVTIPLTRTHRGGATAADYSGVPASVTFRFRERRKQFTLRTTDDDDNDDNESLRIGFGPLPAGVSAGSPAAAAVTLADDSQLRSVVVNFGTSTSVVPKVREGVRFRFTLSLDRRPLRPVTIPLEVTHVGGATEADYEGLPASVTFGPRERQADFILRAVLDQQDEPGEGLRLDFGPLPPGVRKGTWGPYETIEFVDTDPAAQASPSVAGPLLTLGYPGPLDAGSQPAPRDFVVAAEAPGRARAMLAVTAVAVSGSAVVLELDRPVTPEETVTLTYLAAAMHPIRDAAGLPAAPLTDEPVRNDTDASGPLPKAALPPGGMIPAALAVLLEDTPGDAGAERLDLSSRNLTDITALAGRTDLRELYLSGNAIADLSPLAGLTGLRVLDLRDNAITDLSPLAGLAGLQALDLSGNRIADLWPLAGLAALQRLYLSGNAIADLATLAEFPGLRALDLSGNRIADLWPLAGLTALERLNLSDNRIGHLATLAELTGLQVLDLSGNRIAGLWPLAGLAALERLNLSDNRIVDVSTLTGVGGLEVLLLDRNQVADVQALSQLAGLANLGLSDNRIADIGLLAELDRLLRLDLSGNAVADVSALGDVSRLVWLRLPGNPVSSAAPLERLEQLRWLWLDPGPAPGIETSVPPAEQGVAPLWIERTPAR